MPDSPSIEVTHLTKHFHSITATNDLNFRVEPGVVTGFLGPNGAGKTTTLRMILGLVSPTSGAALINGHPYQNLTSPTQTVGAVLEASGFHPGRTAKNHLRTIALGASIPFSRVDQVLAMVGLTSEANRKVGGYSLGMRQRLEVARALIGDPSVLVLDEPTNGLDPQGIAWIRNLLRYLASEGKVILISSHLLAEASQTVDDVLIITNGTLVAHGPLETLLQNSSTTVKLRSPDPTPLATYLKSKLPTNTITSSADLVSIDSTTSDQIGRLLAKSDLVITEMTSSGESLEQLFFQMTEETPPTVSQPSLNS